MNSTPGPRKGQGAAAPSPSPTDPDRPVGGLEILVVEDNPDILRYLVLLLEQAGHRARAAATLAQALDAASRGPVDVLVSDIGLPDGSGHELLRHLRDDRPRLPAVAISGFGSDDDVRHSLDAGFSAHLIKPLDFRRLSAAIRNALTE
jgi:DNA-binding response OmpR family regulator